MFGSGILEAAIGTGVIYILLSLFCLVFNEWISRLQQIRANILQREVQRLLGERLAKALEDQPLIRGMFEQGRYPNYIPTSTFALALIQIGYEYTPGSKGEPGATKVQEKWQCDCSFGFLEGLRLSATSLGPVQARIEKWFDLAMEQASGSFKRRAQSYILAISALIVIGANVDSISIATHLYDSALNHTPTHFPLFWDSPIGPLYMKAAGIALTWAAVSLGAPFWFDMLNKLVNLRQTGLPPDENKRQTVAAGHVA